MDKTNQFNDILHNSKYTSFVYLPGFEQNEDDESGPPTPDLDNSNQITVISPTLKSPPPESTFTYSSPSPDRQIHDDSGIEDPAPVTKNTVDYSSLDVKAIKDRWKQQEKLANSNTAPVRNFHRRMSPAIAAKLETWPVPDTDMNPSDIIKRNSKILPDGNISKSGGGEESPKPCLARISHLQETKDKAGPVKRDIKSLIAQDLAKSQARYDMLSPDSNNHPDCEGANLFSALDSSRHQVVSPKQSNGSNEVFTPTDNKKSGNTMKTNLNDKKYNKKCKDQEALDLSDNDEMIVRFTKGCNISGTNTTKRNSYMIEKDLKKPSQIFLLTLLIQRQPLTPKQLLPESTRSNEWRTSTRRRSRQKLSRYPRLRWTLL
ncbi:uncharacterized protein LOC134816521 isoform X2 [Bolinopsis microptera]|uniref:uncharacterized protein LOC134816521 isoform X2 n=1 Tax=Bolinopsis microptera TaxID=2820187 RepID=UPI003078DEB9